MILDQLIWNVYTGPEVLEHRSGAAFVPTPKYTRRSSNMAATCWEDATPSQLRAAGVCYRVVYRPEHPGNVMRRRARNGGGL